MRLNGSFLEDPNEEDHPRREHVPPVEDYNLENDVDPYYDEGFDIDPSFDY